MYCVPTLGQALLSMLTCLSHWGRNSNTHFINSDPESYIGLILAHVSLLFQKALTNGIENRVSLTLRLCSMILEKYFKYLMIPPSKRCLGTQGFSRCFFRQVTPGDVFVKFLLGSCTRVKVHLCLSRAKSNGVPSGQTDSLMFILIFQWGDQFSGKWVSIMRSWDQSHLAGGVSPGPTAT